MHDTLSHYASPYYDPKKAHEYYERTKKLKGRKTGTSLNDAGKEAKTYVRTQINSKRDQDLKNAESQSKKRTEERKKSAERETYENIRKKFSRTWSTIGFFDFVDIQTRRSNT